MSGWRLLPVDPSPEMTEPIIEVARYYAGDSNHHGSSDSRKEIYAEILAAAPAPTEWLEVAQAYIAKYEREILVYRDTVTDANWRALHDAHRALLDHLASIAGPK